MKIGSLCTGYGGLDMAVEAYFDAEMVWCAECGTYGSTNSSYADNLPIMECPKCMTIMNRIYSAPGIVFKGTGWGGQ